MAYSGGYAGGYADTLVPPAPADQGTGYKVEYPTYRQPLRTTGRAKIRFRVSIITWGAEAHHSTEHTLAAVAATQGAGNSRATTLVDGETSVRHAMATTAARAEFGSHIGDPREDDRFIAFCLATLLENI